MIKDPDQLNQNIEQEEEVEVGAPYQIENINIQNEINIFRYFKQSKNLVQQYLNDIKIIIDKRYDLKNTQSHGNYKAYDNKTHQLVIITDYQDLKYYNKSSLKKFLTGIEIQKFLNHENIQKIYDFNIISYPQMENMYIASEFMETNLYSIIISQQQLTDDHLKYFMYQILRALHYIHSANIMLGFLYPKQILINQDCLIKISDFTRCICIPNKQLIDQFERNVYMSPEYIIEQICTKKSDIWSAGCIFAELINRVKLFHAQTSISQIISILQLCGKQSEDDLKFFSKSKQEKLLKLMPQQEQIQLQIKFPNTNPLALDLLSKMLTFNIEKRFDALQCLQHEYLAELYDPELEFTCDQEFDWSFLDQELTDEDIKMRLYKNQLFFQQN